MQLGNRERVLGLATFQAGDAAFNAIGNQWLTDDLDRLRIPVSMRGIFPIIKGTSAAGLLVGLRWPRLGRLTSAALVVYFTFALGAHARVRDALWRYVPAAGMLAISARTLRSFPAD